MSPKFKMITIATILFACLLVSGSAMAGEKTQQNGCFEFGAGYQGMWVGDFINGISARGWYNDKFGIEANLFYGAIDADVTDVEDKDDSGVNADLGIAELKLLYAPIVRDYSKFYCGIVGSIGNYEVDAEDMPLVGDGENSGDIYGFGVLMGSEFHFQEMPELRFNFDVGYKWYSYDDQLGGTDLDLGLEGVSTTVGIHYYF